MTAAPYPTEWEADVVLRDGSVAHVRPIVPDDADALRTFHAGQSAESIYLRFFAPMRELSDRDVTRFTTVDYHDRVALIATVREAIIGIGRYDKIDSSTAEVAFNVSDSFQGRGVGSMMLEHLTAIACDAGIRQFVAEVLPQNHRMLQVFKDAGYEVSQHVEDGVVHVSFDVAVTERSTAVRLSREHRAESRSVQAILRPESIAVIGASRDSDSVGGRLLANILAGGFTGPVYAVNHDALEVQGLPSYAKVSDLPEAVDLAVIAVPATSVHEVTKECGSAGVRSLLVASGGFAEAGEAGRARQDALRREARYAGMRVLGPNSFGVLTTSPAVSLNATLAERQPPAGRLGLFTQSDALAIALLAGAARRNLGVSTFAAAGHRVDVSANDVMQYWIDDDSTTSVALVLESMGNPRKFARIARQLAAIKPLLVCVTPGSGSFGAEAFAALLRQAGVIAVDNVHQLLDVAQVVAHQPLPTGDRVAVVTNSHSLGELTAHACRVHGLRVQHGPAVVATEAAPDVFRTALTSAFEDTEVDAVVATFIPPLVALDEDVTAALAEIATSSGKPCVATFSGLRGIAASTGTTVSDSGDASAGVPYFALPDDAVAALGAATRYARWRATDHGADPALAGIDRPRAQAVVEDALANDPEGRMLTDDEVSTLLGCYGIQVWPSVRVDTAKAARAAAKRVGYPVILKTASPLLRHQTGLRGTRGDLQSAAAVAKSFETLTNRIGEFAAQGFIVQRMATPGTACVVACAEDAMFGPVVSFSVAGPPTDILDDIGRAIAPLSDRDIDSLIDAPRASVMLAGYRGLAPGDRTSLADVIARVSALADDLPTVASLELNPVNVRESGVDILGAEVRVAPAGRREDVTRRTLA